jgi:hypothetical protein
MTRAEQRLNSNHGRLIRAFGSVPERLRDVPMGSQGWTPRDALAHVLAWQEEALRHLAEPDVPWPRRAERETWNEAAHQRLRHLGWEQVVDRLEANHRALRRHLLIDPPAWFGPCTYWHYTEHTRALLGFLRPFAQSPTAAVAAQS